MIQRIYWGPPQHQHTCKTRGDLCSLSAAQVRGTGAGAQVRGTGARHRCGAQVRGTTKEKGRYHATLMNNKQYHPHHITIKLL